MNQQLEDIFEEFHKENILEEYLTITLIDIPTEVEMKNIDYKTSLTKNELWVFANAYKDTKIGSSFDTIFLYHSPEIYTYNRAVLKYVSVNPSYHVNHLPKGYSAICLFYFPDGKPDLLNKLKPYNTKIDYSRYDTLCMTQKPIMEKILKML
ncbi:MAG TPA: hypothetical protein VIM65_12770 [Cyclobacteriaceae bacterium]